MKSNIFKYRNNKRIIYYKKIIRTAILIRESLGKIKESKPLKEVSDSTIGGERGRKNVKEERGEGERLTLSFAAESLALETMAALHCNSDDENGEKNASSFGLTRVKPSLFLELFCYLNFIIVVKHIHTR